MKKLQKLFISCFDTEYAYAESNNQFTFYSDKEKKDESSNYLFSVEVYDLNVATTLDFICYVERAEDNSGIGIGIYYKDDKTFCNFKKIEL